MNSDSVSKLALSPSSDDKKLPPREDFEFFISYPLEYHNNAPLPP